jgi:hypothetical protein
VTGIHVSALTRLRRAVLGDEDYRVKVIEPYQMLGEVDDALREALGIDVGVPPRKTIFGTINENWKPFTTNDGTEVLVSGDFNITVDRPFQVEAAGVLKPVEMDPPIDSLTPFQAEVFALREALAAQAGERAESAPHPSHKEPAQHNGGPPQAPGKEEHAVS